MLMAHDVRCVRWAMPPSPMALEQWWSAAQRRYAACSPWGGVDLDHRSPEDPYYATWATSSALGNGLVRGNTRMHEFFSA